MPKTAARLLLLPILGLVLLPIGPTLHADEEDTWREKLARGYPDAVFTTIQQAAEQKATVAALPLIETAMSMKFPHVQADGGPAVFGHVSVACGEALQTMGWPGEDKRAAREAEKFLKKAVKSKDTSEQRGLARALGAWGDPVVDEFLADLASGRRDETVQAEALFMAGLLRPTEEHKFAEVRKSVEKAMKSRSPQVRAAACSAAGNMGLQELKDEIVALIRRDQEAYPGLYGVWALRHLDYREGLSPFLHALSTNPKRETREACLKAVVELATPNDIPDLLSLTRQAQKDYRDAAALALGRMASRSLYPETAVTGERTMGPQRQVPEDVILRLIELVQNESEWEVRDAARQSLLKIGEAARPKVQEMMPGSVEFTDEDARLTALELCGLFGAEKAFKPAYKTALYDKSRTVRMFAARALEGIDPTQAVAELEKVVSGVGAKARDYELQAVRALGYIRTQASYETLIGVIETGKENEDLLREVEFALERLTGHRFGRRPDVWAAWREKATHPFHPMIGKFNRQENRREALAKGLYGLTRETEQAVEDGLRWLELQQHPVGLWDGNEKGFGGVVNCEPAYTGLNLLAFLGAGYNGRSGKYREVIRRAAEFLAATQFYDGGFPVTGGTDSSWIYAYLIAMGIWGVTESYALAGMDQLGEPAQWGIDYLVRVQTPGGGWRYGPRYLQSDTSCTSWVLMTLKAGDLVGLDIAQRSLDGIDSWLERCSYDITGEQEMLDDLSTDYDYEVGAKRFFKAFTGYFELSGAEKSALQQTSMTAVGMVCRFFMGWKRSHPFMIGGANYLEDYLPLWMKGLERGQAIAWYHYYWYYGTLAMHQMGGRYWRRWNEKIRRMYTENQRRQPPDLYGSWDPDTAVLNGGRLFSTAMSILSLETYYRFSPLLGEVPEDAKEDR